MLRLILLGLAVYFVYRLLFRRRVPEQKQDRQIKELVKCGKCGTYVSSAEARSKNGKTLCSNKCSGD